MVTRTDNAFNNGLDITTQGVPLDSKTNERYLLHGSKATAIESILNNNFNIKFANEGWYGKAVYFADDPSKSDQYAKADNGVRSTDLLTRLGIYDEEWKPLACTSKAQNKDVFFMFISRVALGCCAVLPKDRFEQNKVPKSADDAVQKERLFLDGIGDSHKMRSVKRLNKRFQSLSVKEYSEGNTNMRFREFTIYNDVVAKITHVVAYVRSDVKPLDVKTAMGKAWEQTGDPFKTQ